MKLAFPTLRCVCLFLSLMVGLAASIAAEDGYSAWLRYAKLPESQAQVFLKRVSYLVVTGDSATVMATREELSTGCTLLLGAKIPITETIDHDGAVLVGTPKSSPLIARLKLDLAALGSEGFVIRSLRVNGRATTVIASAGETGALYGAFHFLRLLQTGQPIDQLNVSQKPR
jgi:alpha-glucuronidase